MSPEPSSDADSIPISLVAHHVFCPRRAWLEAAGEATDTWQMAEGTAGHASADDPGASRPASLRAIDVAHPELGVHGRCDNVEVGVDGSLTVVEYKATPVRRQPVVTQPMRAQLALQVESLARAGHRVSGQAVYFSSHRVRVPVELSAEDFASAREAARQTRITVEAAEAPPPLEDDPRCMGCSHLSVCLPDERAEMAVTRRILVADPDSQVVHVATQGSHVSFKGGRVVVRTQHDQIASIPIERIQGLVVHGNVDLSGALIRELLWRSLSIVWCTGGGRLVGWAVPGAGPNGAERVRQHEASAIGRLDLAREFVSAKIANQATLLRRNGRMDATHEAMRAFQRRAVNARSLTELLGAEGEAAALYFGSFRSMLSDAVRDSGIDFEFRSGRPARDPVNCALNYVYAMLLGDLVRAVATCGLDPHAGFLHTSSRNKPALALDLAEEFRAPVADSVVIGVFNNRELVLSDFSNVLGTTRLREGGRRKLIGAYERRIQIEFRHPVFGYRTTWRRAMEIQARMVLGVIDGTQSRYVGIRIR